MTAPVRTCIGCGGTAPQATLVRLRVGEGAHVVVDAKRQGGRGAWVHPGEACLAKAGRRRAYLRAFRTGSLSWDEPVLRRGLTVAGGRD